MLNARCRIPACRKAAVTIRYGSPSATPAANNPPSATILPPPETAFVPPPTASTTKAATQRPIRVKVAGASEPPGRPTELRTCVRWRAHSGQRMPTGVVVMQSVQIGRPQFEQETFVSRSGCR